MVSLFRAAIAVTLISTSVSVSADSLNAKPITLEQAVARALEQDPWITASSQRQAAALALSNGAAILPDPKFNLGLMSLPTNSFNYNQEAMTQLQVGVSQLLPRGDSLDLQSQKLRQQSHLMPIQREQRRAQVRLTVTQLWIEALQASYSIKLINDNRVLFEQLADIVESSYSSTFGRTRQQDIVRAELELDQLDDRLAQLRQQKVRAEQKLNEWIQPNNPRSLKLNQALPYFDLPLPMTPQQLHQTLSLHPSVRLADQQIVVANTDIKLAEQKYKPEWMVNASYGFRGNDNMGNDRSDLFSIGVSVDVPIFSSKRQDATVQAETYEMESIRTERLLSIRALSARYQTLNAEISQLDERLSLYRDRLLPGLSVSAEAAINAYTADDGSFSEVVQARISELNAKLAELNIRIERNKKVAELDYLLAAQNEGGAS